MSGLMRHGPGTTPYCMTLEEVVRTLDATVLSRRGEMRGIIEHAYCADLMSDVLSFSLPNSLLVTGLTNAQVVRTAEVAAIRAIVFIQNKKPEPDTIELAGEKNIPLLSTRLSMFEACGRLYHQGLSSRFEEPS